VVLVIGGHQPQQRHHAEEGETGPGRQDENAAAVEHHLLLLGDAPRQPAVEPALVSGPEPRQRCHGRYRISTALSTCSTRAPPCWTASPCRRWPARAGNRAWMSSGMT